MKDQQIIELYWQREEAAITESSLKYGAYCHTIAQNILHSPEDSDECVNDTWLRVWNAMPPQRPTRLRMFLAKITRNLAFDRFKAQTAGKRGHGEIALILDELNECIPGQTDVESALIAKELADSMNQFIHRLSPRDCNLFVRRYFFADPVVAIARRYGLTANNVMVSLSRTRKRLKLYLKEEGYL